MSVPYTLAVDLLGRLEIDDEPELTSITSGRSGAGTWLIEADDRRFVLRVQPKERFEGHWTQLVTLQRHAGEHGLAPKILAVDEGERATLSEYVRDVSFRRAVQDPARTGALLRQVAQALGRLHGLPVPAGIAERSNVEHTRACLQRADRHFELPSFALRAWRDFLERPATTAAPVLAHLDLNPTNILYDGERVLFSDWETAGLADGWFDVATVINLLLLDGERERIFVDAYVQQRRLTGFDAAHLAYARRLAYVAYGSTFLSLVEEPGPDFEHSPSLAQCYAAIGQGKLDIGSDGGRWQLAAAQFAGYWDVAG